MKTMKEEMKLHNALLEVISPYLDDFTGYNEEEQAFDIVLAVKELLEANKEIKAKAPISELEKQFYAAFDIQSDEPITGETLAQLLAVYHDTTTGYLTRRSDYKVLKKDLLEACIKESQQVYMNSDGDEFTNDHFYEEVQKVFKNV